MKNMRLVDFVEYHYNICGNLVSDTWLKMPVLKMGNRYYVSDKLFYEIPYGHLFRDGVLMPMDLNKAIKNMLYVINDKRIYTDILMSYYDPYGFGVVYPGELKVYFPIITTDYKFIIRFLKYFYPNIKSMYNMYMDYLESKKNNNKIKK